MVFLSAHKTRFVDVGLAILVLAFAWFLAWLLRRAVDRFLSRAALAQSDPGAQTRFRMIERLLTAMLFFVGVGVGLYLVDISVLRRLALGMFASAGVAGIALGFAAQTVAANLVSGIMISFVQPLRLGDSVAVDGEQGVVEEIGLLYTYIRTWDNRRIVIPNQLLSSRIIRNYTLKDPRMPAEITVRVHYGADLDQVRAHLLAVAEGNSLAVKEPAPSVEVAGADDAGMTIRVVAWAESQAAAAVLAAALREEAVKRLANEGMPRPPLPLDQGVGAG